MINARKGGRAISNQASEDTLTYGVDRGIPGGDFTALSIKKGSTLFTFVGGEAVAIIDVIRTEKLKLLDRLEAQFVEEVVVIFGETEFKKQVPLSAIEAERNKLEAEL